MAERGITLSATYLTGCSLGTGCLGVVVRKLGSACSLVNLATYGTGLGVVACSGTGGLGFYLSAVVMLESGSLI